MKNLKHRINNLTEKQKALLLNQIKLENVSFSNTNPEGSQQLVAYIISKDSFDVEVLKNELAKKLPNYMVPTKFVEVNEFPKLPNGKIDYSVLIIENLNSEDNPTTESEASEANEIEKKLISIWEDILNIEPISIHDNFFEIGGDSILSIQIIARARKKGLFIEPDHIFENQNISELAKVVKTDSRTSQDVEEYGIVPLLPIQHWFFEEHKNSPHHWNQALLFDLPKEFDLNIFRDVLKNIVEHHNALRLQFKKNGSEWSSALDDVFDSEVLNEFDLSTTEFNDLDTSLKSKITAFLSSFDFSGSSLFQVALFDCPGSTNKLLFAAHHLVIDYVSWQILISDFDSLYEQLLIGKEALLPAKSTSYKKWSEHLVTLSESGIFDDDLVFWQNQTCSLKIQTDFPFQLPRFEGRLETENIIMDAETTNLFSKANGSFRTNTEELILTSILLGLAKEGIADEICVGLEKHGRQSIDNDMDLNSTIGWFTTYFPLYFQVGKSQDLKSNIINVKEKFRNIPNKGLSYGVLRYLKKEKSLAQKPGILFNYMGMYQRINSKFFGIGNFFNEGVRSPQSELYYLLQFNCSIENNKLAIKLTYDQDVFKNSTITILANTIKKTLSGLVQFCTQQESTNYTPTDFPEADLSQSDLDNLLNI